MEIPSTKNKTKQKTPRLSTRIKKTVWTLLENKASAHSWSANKNKMVL